MVIDLEGVAAMDIVGHVGGGIVARPYGATSIRDLAWRADDRSPLQPLVSGPSILALLELMPEGDMPSDTVAALFDALLTSPRQGRRSLQRLRFDLDDGVFRWAGAARQFADRDGSAWATAMAARVLDGLYGGGPCFERVFSLQPLNVDVARFVGGGDLAAGRKHLAGIVEATLGERLAAARAQREQWWLHEGEPPRAPHDAMQLRKAEEIFEEFEREIVAGRVMPARMNIRLASIYGPCARFDRIRRAYEV